MKLALLAILLCLSACSGKGDEPIEPTPKPEVVKSEITIDSNIISNGLSFSNDKGEQSISFTTNENWTLSVAATTSGTTWCTPSTTSGTKGNVSVKFTVTENTSYDNRSVSVTIKAGTASKTFTISQKGIDALLVTTDKYEVSQEGGTIEIEVKANIDYKMEISETAKDWIKESSNRALTAYKHTLTISANEELEKREGEIHFKSGDKVETVKVYQAGGAILLLSQNEYNVSDKGDTISVDIKSNFEFGVQMPDVDWLVDEPSSRGLSSHMLKYVIKANEGYDSRSTEIIFFDKNSDLKDTLRVIQAQKDAIVILKKTYEVKAEGEIIEVNFASNVDFEVKMPEVDWISQVSTRVLNEHTLHFFVSENEDYDCRQEVIVIEHGQLKDTITVMQKNYEGQIPYLTFVAKTKQSITMSKAVETLEYSVGNSGDWKELGTNTIAFGGEIGRLKMRGKSSIGTASHMKDYSTFIFENDAKVSCTGDIRTLIDYTNYTNVQTSKARFCYLFHDCDVLTTAPKLPATELASQCYYEMFSYCSLLTQSPELPATELAHYCYLGMFNGCTSLVTAPELPAIKLYDACYFEMFKGCTALIDIPETLPAKTLTEMCYFSMFEGCSSLVSAPELPATELSASCYNQMFKDCTLLVTAPELPAKKLEETCYTKMFYNCTSLLNAPKLSAAYLKYKCYMLMFAYCTKLDSITMLATDVSAEACLFNWLVGFNETTGTFIKSKDMNSLSNGDSGIPIGWIVKNYGEE